MQIIKLLFTVSLVMQGVDFAQSHPLKDSDLTQVGQSMPTLPAAPKSSSESLLVFNENPTPVSGVFDISETDSEKPALTNGASDEQNSSLEYGSLEYLATQNLTVANRRKRSDPCVADVVVNESSKKLVKKSTEKNVTLYFKVKETFSHLCIEMDIKRLLDDKENVRINGQELQAFNGSDWHELNVLAYIGYDLTEEWFIKVSVDGQQIVNKGLFYKSLWKDFQGLRIEAFGASLWRYSKPADHCSPDGQLSNQIPIIFGSTESSDTSVESIKYNPYPDVTNSYATGASESSGQEVNCYIITGVLVLIAIIILVGGVISARLPLPRKRAQRTEDVELRET